MVEHAHQQPDRLDVNHEESDVNIRAIFQFGAGLMALTVVVYVVVWLLFGYLARREDKASAGRMYPLAVGQENQMPPEPRLQSNPRQDLKDLRAAEDEMLRNYQWIDRNAGIVRIPIDEAMRLTLQRGLPSRESAPQETAK